MPDPSLRPTPIAPSASPQEAAAIVAAIERFMRATAPAPQQAPQIGDPWRRAALVEGISAAPNRDAPDPWGNT